MASTSSSDPRLKPEIGGGGGETYETLAASDQLLLYTGLKKTKKERGCTAKERISKMPPCTAGKRSSIYRGVTRHRWTGRYEAHLWDKSTWNQNQNKKGKQVYLGAYDDEEAAARAYDLAALKYWGPGTLINFPVTDYMRDLEEMQNVSREEYLVSLRRTSSGFSRGIAKHHGLSSLWDSSLGRMAAPDYFSHFGDDQATESDFLGGFCVDGKIDLTGYVKWWGANKTRQVDSSSKSLEETNHEDIGSELKTLEWADQPTGPYQMPRLGTPQDQSKQEQSSSVSALTILSQSSAYKSLQEKVSKIQETSAENDENANKNVGNRLDYGKAVERAAGHGVDLGGSSLQLCIQRSMHPINSILSAPLVANYSTLDPLAYTILLTPFVPLLPAGSPLNSEVATKNETAATYSFLRREQ